MFEDRSVRFDLSALALLVVVAFLALSLLTHSPNDPPVELVYPLSSLYQPDVLVYPYAEQPANVCGRWGALASAILFDGLGLGAYYLVVTLGVVTFVMLSRREIDAPLIRTAGWIASLAGFTALASMMLNGLSPGTVLGAGGRLGAIISGALFYNFAHVGGVMLAAGLLLSGLMLCSDYVVLNLLMLLGVAVVGQVHRRAGSVRRRRVVSPKPSDFEGEDREELSVRIGGKDFQHSETDELEDEEEEDGCEDDLAEEDDGVEDEAAEGEEEDECEEEEESTPVAEKIAKGIAASVPRLLRGADRRRKVAALKIAEPPQHDDRTEVIEQLEAASHTEDASEYELPDRQLLDPSGEISLDAQAKEVRCKAKILEKTFASFGFDVKVVEIETGPVIAQYEIELEAGLRLAKITSLADDIAIALRVPSVRIVAPIPGKNTVGIEVPNDERQLVRLGDVMDESMGKLKKMRIPLFLGKDVAGNPMTVDLSTMPHLLIAGRTGTGKSVCLNAIIASILMTRRPDEVRMLMIDPKMVELSGYSSLPHLMHPVVTDMRKAEAILAWAVEKMEERYRTLAKAGVRHISSYNQLSEEEIIERLQPEDENERRSIPLHMPFIVIVADEIADLMMTSGKEVEQHIIRLAQKSRAVGIHLILATQKPTVDVITGLIKSNLPARLAFQVASRTDSRVVLDEMGADKLLGNGDMLFLWPGTSTLVRGQGTYLRDEEINAIVDSVSTGEQDFVNELVHLKVEDGEPGDGPGQIKNRDDLYEDAIEIVIREGRGSVSLLQRALGIGYGRGARLIDFMAEDGIVGPYAGSQAREVLMTMEDWRNMQNAVPDVEEEETPVRSNKILPVSHWRDETETSEREAADEEEEVTQTDGLDEVAEDQEELDQAKELEEEDEEEEEVAAADDDEYEYVYEEEDEEEEDEDPSAEYEEEEYEEYEEEEEDDETSTSEYEAESA